MVGDFFFLYNRIKINVKTKRKISPAVCDLGWTTMTTMALKGSLKRHKQTCRNRVFISRRSGTAG